MQGVVALKVQCPVFTEPPKEIGPECLKFCGVVVTILRIIKK
jgi:hypothetical protein